MRTHLLLSSRFSFSGRLPLLLWVILSSSHLVLGQSGGSVHKIVPTPIPGNLAAVATPTLSYPIWEPLTFLNDGLTPTRNMSRGNNRPAPRTQVWAQYEWSQPVTTQEISVYWWNFNGVLRLPEAYRITYWDGKAFVPVGHPEGCGRSNKQFNRTTFDAVTTTRMRLELDSADRGVATLQEWVVQQSEHSVPFSPQVSAGGDRDVMQGGKSYFSAVIRSVDGIDQLHWNKLSGPGEVHFDYPDQAQTTATFSQPGVYRVGLTVREGALTSQSEALVKVVLPPPAKRLDVIYTKKYRIDSRLWSDRAKALIVHWIPWCIAQCERTDLKTGEGGLDNFIEAAKALKGLPHGRHKGYVFSNAWVHQTIESICLALMVDPQGDPEIVAAQEMMRKKLEEWIPVVLAAKEPDGYLQTAYTLRDTARWKERWAPQTRGNHEGYVAGYFLESAINHYTLTDGSDKRLYNAAKRLADCWVAHLGPGKKAWFDGHQEMEQALVRFGRFVNDVEGKGSPGDRYIQLAKFLLDNRGGGSSYDQSHVPVQQQYEAVGHAVRAVYNYSAMADVAAETGDTDYQSAVLSLWDNMVNKKYYLTGGIGSGETSEGFGDNYSLGDDAYCESCSSCGLIFFQYKMNLAYHDAKYADLYEETLYNALLGSIDLDGKNFTYTNPLASAQGRYKWHVCPCCVGNIPRTLLMIPTWSYAKGEKALFVKLYIGSTIRVGKVAGTDVEMVQKTHYPWDGQVVLTVNPADSREFDLCLRIPDRNTSLLYRGVPEVQGLKSLRVNGKPFAIRMEHGYAVIHRLWKKGDQVMLDLPMEVQQIRADEKITTDRGKVAYRYGPMIYNVESADQPNIEQKVGSDPMSAEWKSDFLHGVVVLHGKWADGSPLLAIPNYARLNRVPTTEDDNGEEGNGQKNPAFRIWLKEN